jgi:LysR family transcriptional regulator, transcription activator of glutamate synthase operon
MPDQNKYEQRFMMLKVLPYFVTVADTHDFTKAALKLEVSPAYVRRQIRVYEKAMGFPLFEVKQGKLHLAPGGALMMPYARKAVFHHRRIIAIAKAARKHSPESPKD